MVAFHCRITLFLLFLNLSAYKLNAQQALPHTLLWKITGKTLKKPSYLFGTMHLSDKRLFFFGDSVYNAIEHTEGLAIELNPDELIAYEINKEFDNEVKSRNINEVVDQKFISKYNAQLSKKFKKPVDEITTKDIFKEKNKWVGEYLKRGEMPTFLDAYLYNIARKLGKWVGGIEDIADQAGIMDELIDKSDVEEILKEDNANATSYIENMIKSYNAENLETIEEMVNGYGENKRDLLLIKRNLKMARRMDSLSAFRSMFFAVGAAHLPGDSGVINMLRARGFTVDPVFSDKKINPDDYKINEVETYWVKVNDEQTRYTAEMPGNPTPLNLYGVLKMKLYFNLFTLSGYWTMAVRIPKNILNKDSIYTAMATNIFGKKNTPLLNKIEHDGITGAEFIGEKDDYSYRIQLLTYNNILYMVMLNSAKKDFLKSTDANRFFNSFTINKSYVTDSAANYIFCDSVFGISLSSPVKLERNETYEQQVASKDYLTKVYSGLNTEPVILYLLLSRQVLSGYHLANDSVFLESTLTNTKGKYTVTSTEHNDFDGYPAIKATAKNKNLGVSVLSIIRGNKAYSLIIVGETATMKKPIVSNSINSLKIIPYKQEIWQQHYSPDKTFSSWVPAGFIQIDSETTNNTAQSKFAAYDSVTGTSYIVFADTLNEYQWAESYESILNKKIKEYYSKKDSLIYNKPISNKENKGLEVCIKKAGSRTHIKARLLLKGNVFYTAYVAGEPSILNSKDGKRFLTDFTLNNNSNTFNITESKAQKLLADIASKDSVTALKARDALKDAPFTKSDLGLLHNSIFKNYIYNGYNDDLSINNKIARKIVAINSPATVEYIKNRYPSLAKDHKEMKEIALEILAQIETRESYNTLADFMVLAPPEGTNHYFLYSCMSDSLMLLNTIYPNLSGMIADSSIGAVITALAKDLRDSGFLAQKIINDKEEDFLKLATIILPDIKKDSVVSYRSVLPLLNILGTINTPKSIQTLRQFLNVGKEYAYIKENALMELIKAGHTVEPLLLNEVAKDPKQRTTFYNHLQEINKEILFPKTYLTQKYFAEAAFYDRYSDDYEIISIKYIAEKQMIYNDVKLKFFLFKVSTKDEQDNGKEYLGISGGYTINNPNNIFPEEADATILTDEEYNASTNTKRITEYLNN